MKRLEFELPLYIEEEIMKRLPVKSLVQLRSVSKSWKSLIDRSEFITLHSHTQQQHLLVSFEYDTDEIFYVSYNDDDTFPQQRSYPTPPLSVRQLTNAEVVGSSQGLVCLYGSHPNLRTNMVVLWNPSIRKSIAIDVTCGPYISFGVCLTTSDPKIVSIKQSWDEPCIETSYRCKVMVCTLSTGKWKSSSNLPTKLLRDLWPMVASDRFIYWHAESPTHTMILSFDVTNENFEVKHLPDSLALHNDGFLYIFELGESLAIIENRGNIYYNVWRMEHGAQRSFTIETPHEIVGFRNSGMPIMKMTRQDDDDDDDCKLVVYEPNSEENIVLQTTRPPYRFYLNSYMETLLLLGRSDCTSY